MKLLFATHNTHKAEEIADIFAAVGCLVEVTSLSALGDQEEIVESGTTLEENALLKAREGYRRHGIPSFADDTGLEVEALGGAPGVYSARYAGSQCWPEDNICKLLEELEGVSDRKARFRTVVALVLEGKEYLFEGSVMGEILSAPVGDNGFGYDPLFRPEGYPDTFATMSEAEKNKISHRGRAIEQLIRFLKAHGEV